MVDAATENPDLEGPAQRLARRHLARYQELLTALATAADVTDPDLVGRQLLVVLEGATIVAAITGDPGAAQAARSVVRALLT